MICTKFFSSLGAAVVLLSVASAARAQTASLRPVRLRCESSVNPLGVDEARPGLSWILDTQSRDQRQQAYRILVSTAPRHLEEGKADLWDSGVVPSPATAQVEYAGQPLTSLARCYWKVRVWDQAGNPSPWSAPAVWEMGLLEPEDWLARWIGSGPAREPRPAAGYFQSTNELAGLTESVEVESRSTLLRKEIRLRRGIRRARAFVSGLGYYELFCNGRRVGDQVLSPAKSNYRRWVMYDTHDVTSFLKPGVNVLGLMLGNGWFNPAMKWWEPYRMQWFGAKRGLVQLHVDYADGSTEVIVTDATWKTAPGPVLASCIYDGEHYDATQELPGWDTAGFDDRAWRLAKVVEPPGGRMVSQRMPPVRVTQHLKPIALTHSAPGAYLYDLGQNCAGWARLSVAGPRGTRVTLRYAEDLHPDGTLDPRSNERALSTDVYTLKGEGRETYEPRFTFHGFRYVEVTGFPGVPRRDNILGCVVHTACAQSGSLESSGDLINRIHRATSWSQRSCMIGYPLDCPQRDERLGWMGDALVTADEMLLNFDASVFLRQWLDGVQRDQNPADGDISIVSPRPYTPAEPDPTWSSAYPILVWQLYLDQGDRRFLDRHFDSMSRYVDYLGTQATNHILPRYWIGDWGSIVEGWKEGDPPAVTTAFYYLDAITVAKAARALGRTAEAARYEQLATEVKAAFRRTYFDPGKNQFDPGSEFSNAFPLLLGLAEEHERAAVLQHVLDDLARRGGHFDVGVLGAKYLIEALSEHGRPDVAFALATQTGYPGWAHMLEDGRTTLSEFWDLKGSHNHAMMGSIDAWFYRTLAGIRLDESRPGYEHIVIRPFIPVTLDSMRASAETVRGRVAVAWEKRDGDLRLHVTIPANATATVQVPAPPGTRVRCRPSRSPARQEHGTAVFDLGSGRYAIRAGLKPPGLGAAVEIDLPAIRPVARTDENSRIAHDQLVEKARKGGIDVYFTGDSITRRWGATDPQYAELLQNWTTNFFGWNAANFGWGGDRIENILWRLQNGELDGVHPKIIVILAGINDVGTEPHGDERATHVSAGVETILDVCRQKAPAATIIITALFPRNDSMAVIPMINEVNRRIAALADGTKIRFIDINRKLADEHGRLLEGMVNPDQLHPTVKAYQIWADALKPSFTEILGPPASTDHAPPPTGDPAVTRK
jgi:alpha-L-rhamnosidase